MANYPKRFHLLEPFFKLPEGLFSLSNSRIGFTQLWGFKRKGLVGKKLGNGGLEEGVSETFLEGFGGWGNTKVLGTLIFFPPFGGPGILGGQTLGSQTQKGGRFWGERGNLFSTAKNFFPANLFHWVYPPQKKKGNPNLTLTKVIPLNLWRYLGEKLLNFAETTV